jgi:hypothetical protein
MKRSFFVKYYSIAFAILPGKAGGLAVELIFENVQTWLGLLYDQEIFGRLEFTNLIDLLKHPHPQHNGVSAS